MAKILPFRGLRYAPPLARDIGTLVSPLFDVVSARQRRRLYDQQHNSIHLSVPQADEPAMAARKTLADWRQQGVIVQDDKPGLYVYYQYFVLPGSTREHVRKGFICNIYAYDWEKDKVVMRHENTIPHSVNDRVAMLEETQLNVSPTHGLYADESFTLEAYMDQAIEQPLYEIENYQGVRDVLAVIDDPEIVRVFVELLADKQVILADGHHRYESSMLYRAKQQAANGQHTGQEGYNYHMMYLTNMESDDLRILPTHRLIRGLEDFSQEDLMARLSEDFHVRYIDDPYDLEQVILSKTHAFGLMFKEQSYKIRLKEELYGTVPWKFPAVVNNLDLTVMHYFVIEKGLGIPGKEQRASKAIDFERSVAVCRDEVRDGNAQLAIIMKDVHVEEVKQVCHSGYTMPQKSTYFYPKVICGFVFSSIADEDFALPTDTSL